jgi:CNT family concentrative nucleoside transporter
VVHYRLAAALSVAAIFSTLAPPSVRAQDAGAEESVAGDDQTASAGDSGVATSLRDIRESARPVPWYQRAISLLGLLVIVGLGWLASTDRKRVPWRIIGWGLSLQILFGLFVLKTDLGRSIFEVLNDGVMKLLGFTAEGSEFIFQNLRGEASGWLVTFAFGVLPTIIFFSSLMAVLYHLGVMQKLVAGIAWAMRRTMGTSGSETLSVAANIFVGQTEAPLLVKPFVDRMTRSELHAMMVGGFATVAGGVLAAYVKMFEGVFTDMAGHLIAASVMSAPAAMVVAKVMLPETEESSTTAGADLKVEKIDANFIDAAARGAGEGLMLALNVAAMLLAFIALVALVNFLLGLPFEAINAIAGSDVVPVITMEMVLGWVFWPVAFVMGVPFEDCTTIATLLGEKLVLNEFVAYAHLSDMLRTGTDLSYRSVVIATYALCGFANFSSIAIQIGGIGGIAPGRRSDVASLGLRAMIGGTLAACMTATVAGSIL